MEQIERVDSSECIRRIRSTNDAKNRSAHEERLLNDLLQQAAEVRSRFEIAERDLQEALLQEAVARSQWTPEQWRRFVEQAIPQTRSAGFL